MDFVQVDPVADTIKARMSYHADMIFEHQLALDKLSHLDSERKALMSRLADYDKEAAAKS